MLFRTHEQFRRIIKGCVPSLDQVPLSLSPTTVFQLLLVWIKTPYFIVENFVQIANLSIFPAGFLLPTLCTLRTQSLAWTTCSRLFLFEIYGRRRVSVSILWCSSDIDVADSNID